MRKLAHFSLRNILAGSSERPNLEDRNGASAYRNPSCQSRGKGVLPLQWFAHPAPQRYH